MQDIQKITDAWGNWFAVNHNTACDFTASTNYSAQSLLDSYHENQVVATLQALNYDTNGSVVNGADYAYELWYDNGTDLQQSEQFIETKTTQQAFTWSLTEALEVGVTLSEEVGVPTVAKTSATVSVKLNLSSTQTTSTSNTQTWQVNTPVQVPAQKSVKADMVINTASYQVNYTAETLLSGYVAVWCRDQVDGHYLWFYPIGWVFTDVINNKLADASGYTLGSGGVIATARGTFTGGQGLSVGVVTKQYPLRSTTAPKDFKPVVTHSIPSPAPIAGLAAAAKAARR